MPERKVKYCTTGISLHRCLIRWFRESSFFSILSLPCLCFFLPPAVFLDPNRLFSQTYVTRSKLSPIWPSRYAIAHVQSVKLTLKWQTLLTSVAHTGGDEKTTNTFFIIWLNQRFCAHCDLRQGNSKWMSMILNPMFAELVCSESWLPHQIVVRLFSGYGFIDDGSLQQMSLFIASSCLQTCKHARYNWEVERSKWIIS